VARSCIQTTSGLFGVRRFQGNRPDLTIGGVVRGSTQGLISEWPSANDMPPAVPW
jgi:hypothetical protein